MGPSRRWPLSQATHSRVASSTAFFVFLSARRCICSDLYRPLIG